VLNQVTESQLINMVEAMQQHEARKRIPDHMRGTSPYSALTFWTYYALGDADSKCNYCNQFDGQSFTGSQLRTTFPDHEWQGDDIYPNVHMTLWGKDTCKCLLIREPEQTDLSTSLSFWDQTLSTDWRNVNHNHSEDEL
jgi:hypothetical protein